MPNGSAQDIIQQKKQEVLDVEGVQGIGVGRGSGERINVYVKELDERTKRQIPATLNGVPTRAIEAGEIRAQPLMADQMQGGGSPTGQIITPQDASDADRTSRKRPAPGGVSIGHPNITAGTLGVLTGRGKILTNNHVGAAASTTKRQRASPGDAIIQPGAFDGGESEDKIAELEDFVPLDPEGGNLVDAAVAQPVDLGLIDEEIIDLGDPTGTAEVEEGETLRKSGRTTSTTRGTVIDTSATIKVSYGSDIGQIEFEDQIITTAMSKGGDSGSVTVNEDGDAVGLLFAGSSTLTVHNKIQHVEEELGVSIKDAPREDGGLPSGSAARAGGLITGGLALSLVGQAVKERFH